MNLRYNDNYRCGVCDSDDICYTWRKETLCAPCFREIIESLQDEIETGDFYSKIYTRFGKRS